MGGVGGAGESQFNARSIGIETLRVPGNVSSLQLVRFIASFYPGLVGSDGTISTVAPLPHFGGNPEQQKRRSNLMQQLEGSRGEAGGPATHPDLEAELASNVGHVSANAIGRFLLTAKSFHRNTPALFGAGLIDGITDEQIEQQAKLQRRKKNVSGRPATLSGGGIGRFGWRANMATLEEFTRQACENELGLHVESDPPVGLEPPAAGFVPVRQSSSRSPRHNDISMQDLQSLTAFLKSLPAPSPIRPTDPEQLELVVRGEQLFEEVGCSVCHVQTLGPAENLYSDLLLHDMGETLRGPSTADPYIYAYDEVVLQPTVVPSRTYYGGSVPLSQSTASTSAGTPSSPGGFGPQAMQTHWFVRPYQARPGPIQIVPIASRDFVVDRPSRASFRRIQRTTVRQVKVRRNRVRATNVSQEWRTAPLWGLRDSAPYMHDGRAATVDEAIQMHDGESNWSRRRYQLLKESDQAAVLAFLATFAAPVNAPQPGELSWTQTE